MSSWGWLFIGAASISFAAFSFFATLKWNAGIYFCVVAYGLAAWVSWRLGRPGCSVGPPGAAARSLLVSMVYGAFVLTIIGSLWSVSTNLVLCGSGAYGEPRCFVNNLVFGVFVVVVVAVKLIDKKKEKIAE